MSNELHNQVNRIAETHFFLRGQLESALKHQVLSDDARAYLGKPYQTYYEFWIESHSRNFFDMTSMTRLGTAIEVGLKAHYMKKKNYATNAELYKDNAYSQGVFQRIMPWSRNNAIELFSSEVNVDLSLIPELVIVQEVMLHRHLYAHNSGLVDDKYISDLKRLTSEDLLNDPAFTNYPAEELYWFRPLSRLNQFIEDTRRFARQLN